MKIVIMFGVASIARLPVVYDAGDQCGAAAGGGGGDRTEGKSIIAWLVASALVCTDPGVVSSETVAVVRSFNI